MDLLTPPEPDKKEDAPVTPGVVIPAAPSAPARTALPAAQSGAGHVDMDKILLPKKEVPGHTPLSAQRINAGALLEQEITAGALGTDTQQAHVEEKAAEAKIAEAAPAPLAEESIVKPLETFQHDIESVVQQDNVSVLSIATAEANRRAVTGEEEPEVKKQRTRSLVWNSVMIAGGFIFLVAASGALAYLVARTTPVPITADTTQPTNFIAVDAVKEITITPEEPRGSVLSSLNAAREATSLSLGLMAQLLVTESSSTSSSAAPAPLAAQDFFTQIAPHIPPALARALKPDYLLGVHVYTGNQPFVIANVYSYEEAYAGMLAWEPYLQQDLSPLFDYTPSQRIQAPVVTPANTGQATATPATTGAVQTGFVDKIVENHDARVLQNGSGDIYLLWTFIDRNTLVITTNDATLREILSRLKDAPSAPRAGQ